MLRMRIICLRPKDFYFIYMHALMICMWVNLRCFQLFLAILKKHGGRKPAQTTAAQILDLTEENTSSTCVLVYERNVPRAKKIEAPLPANFNMKRVLVSPTSRPWWSRTITRWLQHVLNRKTLHHIFGRVIFWKVIGGECQSCFKFLKT